MPSAIRAWNAPSARCQQVGRAVRVACLGGEETLGRRVRERLQPLHRRVQRRMCRGAAAAAGGRQPAEHVDQLPAGEGGTV